MDELSEIVTVDCSTGKVTRRPPTEQEIEEHELQVAKTAADEFLRGALAAQAIEDLRSLAPSEEFADHVLRMIGWIP